MKNMICVCSRIAFIYALVYSIVGIYGNGTGKYWYLTIIAAGCVGGYFAREKLRRLSVFLAVHIVFAAAVFFAVQLFHVSEGYFVLAVILSIGSVCIRLVPSLSVVEEPGYIQLAALAIFFAMDSYLKMEQEAALTSTVFFAMFLAKILYANLKAAEEFVFHREASTKIDKENFHAQNNWVSILYVGAIGILLALTSRIHAGAVFDKIREGIKEIFRFLFQFLGRSETKTQEFTDEITACSEMQMGEEIVAEPSLFAKILNEIIRIGASVVLAVIVIAVIAVVVLAVYRSFYRKESVKRNEGDETESLMMERSVKKKRKKFLKIFGRSPSDKIRRMYKKSMNHFWGKNALVPKSFDPAEQIAYARALMPEENGSGFDWLDNLSKEQCERLRQIYEKARYSEEMVTAEEIRFMEGILRH